MSRSRDNTYEEGWGGSNGDVSGWGTSGGASTARPRANHSASTPDPTRGARPSAEPRTSASPATVKFENNHVRPGSASSPKRPLPLHSERDDYSQTHSLMKSQRGEPAHGRRVLFVQGFPPTMRARDLAYEFERMGPLVRVDLPALADQHSQAYGFFEYEDAQDALAAYHDMHGYRFGAYSCQVSWANKQTHPDVGRNSNYAHGARNGSYSHRPFEEPRRRSASPQPRDTRGFNGFNGSNDGRRLAQRMGPA